MLVIGVLIGAAIAYTLLASSIPMWFNVQSSTALKWEELDRPDTYINRGTWYNTTPIHYNLSNTDPSQEHMFVNYIRFNQSGSNIDMNDIKGAFKYHKDGAGWSSWQDMTFSTEWYGPNSCAEGEFGKGLEVEKFDDTGCWIEFKIRFWIDDYAPTGWWHVTLITANYHDIYP